MGSSSAWGYFTINGNQLHPRDSGWAFKVKKHFKDLGVIDTLFNISASGNSCYDGMPSSYVPPPGRNLPYPGFNITRAVTLLPKPDVIIVNYPSNQYDFLSQEEVLFCLQTIKDSANAAGIICFITTTQPRDNFNLGERQKLKDLRDAIMQRFGAFAIDFWTDITVPVNMMNPLYNLGDNVHLNPAGHTLLKNRVVNANIFFGTVPVSFLNFNLQKKTNSVSLMWSTAAEQNSHHFEIQKSRNGQDFVSFATLPAAGNTSQIKNYSIEDLQPYEGTGFYRIVSIDMNNQKLFSKKLSVNFSATSFYAGDVYENPVANHLLIQLESVKNETVIISLISAQGKVLNNEVVRVNKTLLFKKQVEKIAAGKYVLRINTGKEILNRHFVKL